MAGGEWGSEPDEQDNAVHLEFWGLSFCMAVAAYSVAMSLLSQSDKVHGDVTEAIEADTNDVPFIG